MCLKKFVHAQIKLGSKVKTINILLSLTVLYCSERSLVLHALPPTSTYNSTVHSGEFSSYLSSEFTAVVVENPPDVELVKYTYNTTIAVVRQVRKVRRWQRPQCSLRTINTLLVFQA